MGRSTATTSPLKCHKPLTDGLTTLTGDVTFLELELSTIDELSTKA